MTQTTPSYSAPVCPGGRLVVTCVITNITGYTYWRYNATTGATIVTNNFGTTSKTGNVLILNVTNISGTTITTTGNIESVSKSMNGTVIACSSILLNNYTTLIINIRGN